MKMRRARSVVVTSVLLAALSAQASESAEPRHDAAAAAAADEADKPSAAAVTPAIAEKLLLANRYLEQERADDALAVVDQLLRVRKLKPVDLAQIHRFRGYILVAKNDSAGAMTEFEQALASDALDDGARQVMMYSLAQLYTQAERLDEARSLIDRWFAAAVDPKPEAFLLKAMILVQQQAYAEALEPARQAVERSPQPRESWLQLLASIQFQLQDYAALTGTLQRLVAVAPGNKRYWMQLATIENSLGKDAEALASIGIAHEAGLLSDDKELRQRARMCFVRELPDCCVATLEDGIAAGTIKPDAEAYRLLANCLIAGRETEKAAEPLARAGELGDGARSWLLLGQLQLQQENFDDARVTLQKALTDTKPGERAPVELLLGIAQLGSRRFDDAERAFKVAQADAKTRVAADSYLKHLEQKRALDRLREQNATAAAADGEPVSSAKASASSDGM